jgi:hypothetical protein
MASIDRTTHADLLDDHGRPEAANAAAVLRDGAESTYRAWVRITPSNSRGSTVSRPPHVPDVGLDARGLDTAVECFENSKDVGAFAVVNTGDREYLVFLSSDARRCCLHLGSGPVTHICRNALASPRAIGHSERVRKAAALVMLAILIAGCGGGSETPRASPAPRTTTSSPVVPAVECIAEPDLPLPWPKGARAPEGVNPLTLLRGAAWPPGFDMEGALRDRFAERFSDMWMTHAREPDLRDQWLIVGVVGPTPEDRDYVATLPVFGGKVRVAATTFSETQLLHYQSALVPIMMLVEHSIWGVGTGLRGAVGTPTSEPAVIVMVTACDPNVMRSIASLVPPEAVQARVSPKPSLL